MSQHMQIIAAQKDKFITLNDNNDKLLDWENECLFARQQIEKNDFSLKVANNNQGSLKAAILNVAAIGISLNPASQHAYLVPRDGAICLDISFQGLKKIATDSGAIEWAKVELVYESDTFEWNGPTTPPTHKADPFSERGNVKGGYCIAKLPSGEFMTEVMSAAEINKIRDTSKAFKNGKGPWVNWYDEMAKKTILKRAFKQWPQTPSCKRERLEKAVSVSHETEGSAFTIEQHGEYMKLLNTQDAIGFYAMRSEVGDAVWTALYNSFEKGQKTAMKEAAKKLESEGIESINSIAHSLKEYREVGDEYAAQEALQELTETELKLVQNVTDQETVEWVLQLEKAA